jgi:hypothetical protein
MINKVIQWLVDHLGPKREVTIDAWPFPTVLGTPPSCAEKAAVKVAATPKKKRGRPALKKASTRAPAVKKTVKKLAKKAK